MDETSFLSNIENFFTTALNWATPANSPSVAANGTPAVGSSTNTFDLSGANAVSSLTGSGQSGMTGNYNSDFAFLQHTFDSAQNFLSSVATPVTQGITAGIQSEASAQQSYANALSQLANAQSSGFSFSAGLGGPSISF